MERHTNREPVVKAGQETREINPARHPENSERRPFRCISPDLEAVKNSGRIRALAAVGSDNTRSVIFPARGKTLSRALAELDRLAEGADFVLGHNIIAFDLPHLQAANPGLNLLRMPVVDTLRLNPLAFPRNPYHHPVKHYRDGQLMRGRRNDPLPDAGSRWLSLRTSSGPSWMQTRTC